MRVVAPSHTQGAKPRELMRWVAANCDGGSAVVVVIDDGNKGMGEGVDKGRGGENGRERGNLLRMDRWRPFPYSHRNSQTYATRHNPQIHYAIRDNSQI